MAIQYHHPVDVLGFACNLQAAGQAIAWVIVTSVTGGAMRAPGAMMCISEIGDVAGYVSNGCVDADIVLQAREAIANGQSRHLIYGEGSPFKDIALPCGGRIDLMIIPSPSRDLVNNIHRKLLSRKPVTLSIGPATDLSVGVVDNPLFSITYNPQLKLRIVGRGDGLAALARQAQGSGLDVVVQSPDEDLIRTLTSDISCTHLMDPMTLPPLQDDPWTAVVFMFHDHSWEPALLEQAVSGSAFYIGAMGSVKTHAHRKATLSEMGLSEDQINRISGPIGLIPSMRDANLLALSTLAEIVTIAQKEDRL